MINKFFSTSTNRLVFLWVLSIVAGAFCLWFIRSKYIEWQGLIVQLESLDRFKAESDNLTAIAQVCGGLVLLAGLFLTGRNTGIDQRHLNFAEDEKITDRFSKAVEQLESDKLEIRLSGIYALDRIAINSEKDYPQVMKVLTAFVREKSSRGKNEIHDPSQRIVLIRSWHPPICKEKLDTDIQVVLTVIGRRSSAHRKSEKWHVDFSKAYLSKAFLPKAYFGEARFEDAILYEANLEESYLGEVHLEGANLKKAHLQAAYLGGARLERGRLEKAHLEKAILYEARLEGADLSEAHLEKAILYRAHLEKAILYEAHLEDAELYEAHLEGANLSEAHLEGANLDRAHLEGAENLTIEQLSSAKTLYNVHGLDSTLLKQIQDNYPHLLEKP